MKVSLVLLSGQHAREHPQWSLGTCTVVAPTIAGINAAMKSAVMQQVDFCMLWHEALPLPDETLIDALAQEMVDVWHSGLQQGMAGQPSLMQFVNPTWMLNRDGDKSLETTSWRLSLTACLIRTERWLQLGELNERFETLEGAGLELGFRWLRHGAIMRYTPRLLLESDAHPRMMTSARDGYWFVRCGFGRIWTLYAATRALGNRQPLRETLSALRFSWQNRPKPAPQTLLPEQHSHSEIAKTLTVTVLIPTIERYPHLFKLLAQLRDQTVAPNEIIVIDQTPMPDRDSSWPDLFRDLPLKILFQEQAGQCSSRNAGLQIAQGDTILFLDDDDEIPSELIEKHIHFLQTYQVDASCGVAEELGAGPLPFDFTYVRMSDVFPTNNTLLRREALSDSGLFDMAYERGARADGDLGMRLYLAGKKLMLNPSAKVLHLHAPRGGLRSHKARVITRGSSRASLWQRQLIAPTEGYLLRRYFTSQQVRESLLIRCVSSLRGRGGRTQRLLRFFIMLFLLPDTYLRNRARIAAGSAMLRDYPSIPTYAPK